MRVEFLDIFIECKMKDTTLQIKKLIESDELQNLKLLRKKMDELEWSNYENQEMTLSESMIVLESMISVLDLIIKKDIFEQLVGYWDRRQILNLLNSVKEYLIYLKNWSDYRTYFIQHIQSLFTFLSKYNFEIQVDWYPDYQKKIQEVKDLKLKYQWLIKVLNKAEELRNNLIKYSEIWEEKKEKISLYLEEVTNLKNSISSIKQDIDTRYEEVRVLNNNIVKYESDIEIKKEDINDFFKEIASFKEEMSSWLDNIENYLENSERKTNEIISRNEKLQEEIYSILGKAIGTNLYSSFKEKAKNLLIQMRWRLLLLISSIVFFTYSGWYVLETLIPFFQNWSLESVSMTFLIRLSLLFPAIYLVYFSASEFKNTVKLKEEYDFKSSVAVVLHHFKDLVEKSKEEKDKDFLINSITKIFGSPTELAFGKQKFNDDFFKKTKEITGSVAEIAGKLVNK